MIRDELMARISSLELSKWMAKMRVEKEEYDLARDIAESEDGIVHVYGQERQDEDDELSNGETE